MSLNRLSHGVRGGGVRGENGFTLADALIAVGVLIFGILAVVNVLPSIAKLQAEARTSTAANLLAISKMDHLRSIPYDQVLVGAPQSGDFTSIIGTANFSNLGKYTWTYTATESISGIQKRVDLGIRRQIGTSYSLDTYTFYLVDIENKEL